jgi:hypothetical protein
MSVTAMLELAPDLAKALHGVSVSVPGLNSHTGEGAKFAFGAALNLEVARVLAKRFAVALTSLGKACNETEWVERAERLTTGLEKPLPPMIADLRGIVGVVLDGEFGLAGAPPKNLAGYAVLVAKDPSTVLATAKQMIGGKVALDIPADGKFHPINLGAPTQVVDSLAGAIKNDRLLLVGGAKARGAAEKLLDVAAKISPIFLIRYDMGALMKLAEGKMKQPTSDAEKAGQDLVKQQFGSMGMVGLWLYTARRGLGFHMKMEFKKPPSH